MLASVEATEEKAEPFIMPVFLEVRSGPQAGGKVRLDLGQTLRVGRTTGDFVFADDSHMSGAHFSIQYVENECHFNDLNSRNGSWLNGERVNTAVLKNGDTVVAGETTFAVTIEAAEAVAASADPPSSTADAPHDRLLAMLRTEFQPLYAILDTARDARILALLLYYKEECMSLYEGAQGAKLAEVAPYLVRLQEDSRLLEALVREGWGKSWGVYLTCASEFQELRRHLRHFLEVALPEGEQVYFRFYDPRVMRVFLPTSTPEESAQFFGPIQAYLLEDEQAASLLRFANTGRGSEKKVLALGGEENRQQAARAAGTQAATWADATLPNKPF